MCTSFWEECRCCKWLQAKWDDRIFAMNALGKVPFIVRDVESAIFWDRSGNWKQLYCILPIIGFSKIEAPQRFGNQILSWRTKIGLISLIIYRFSIRNHRWNLAIVPGDSIRQITVFFTWYNVWLALIYLSFIVRLTQNRDWSVFHLILWSICRKLDQAFSEW